MKFDYFKTLENKYKSHISKNKTLIIRLDGRNVCGNYNLDLFDESNGSLSDSMKKVAKYISEEYACIVYVGSDELNIIIRNPEQIICKYESQETHKIASLISQEVFFFFNKCYNQQHKIFFDARCFSIPKNKVISYLQYRYKSTVNVLTVYFAKNKARNIKRTSGMKLSELNNSLKKIKLYNERTDYQKEGISYYFGVEYKPTTLINQLQSSNIKRNHDTKLNIDLDDEIVLDTINLKDNNM